MKTPLIRRLFLTLLVATASFMTTEAGARPPQPQELCGEIVELDAAKRTFTIRATDRPTPLALVWKSDTLFIKGQTPGDSTALTKGARICVYYRAPFFGDAFATKVVLPSASGPK